MFEIEKCPFCKGKAKVNARQHKFYGENDFGNKKISWAVYVVCNKCHARGKPIITEPIKLHKDEIGSLGVGNFWNTKWGMKGNGIKEANETFAPYVEKAIESWNKR